MILSSVVFDLQGFTTLGRVPQILQNWIISELMFTPPL